MKAIQTKYKGYRFRSRLEARWAVFFDTLGIKWEYEPQSFDLGGGVRYLPDFFIGGKYYAEVKPVAGDIGQFEKARLMSRHGVVVIGLGGMPDTVVYPVFEAGETFDVAINGDGKYGPFYWQVGLDLWENWQEAGYLADYKNKFKNAVFAARSARFEFGESGAAR